MELGATKEAAPGEEVSGILVTIVVAIVVMVMIVPIALGVPTAIIFVPPAVTVLPAGRAGGGKLRAVFGGLRAVPAVVFDGFMEFVIGVGDAALAVTVCARRRGTSEKKCCAQSGGGDQTAKWKIDEVQLH